MALSLISVISVSALPPAFEHTRETIIKALDSEDIGQSYEYGDRQAYNWNYSNPSDYSFNSTEMEVSDDSAKLKLNESIPEWSDWSSELMINPGFEWINFTGWQTYTEGTGQWRADESGFYSAYKGSGLAWIDDDAVTGDHINQTVNVGSYGSYIDAGNAQINCTGWMESVEDTFDYVRLSITALNSTQGNISKLYDSGYILVSTWTQYGVNSTVLPVNTRYILVRFFTVEEGWDCGRGDEFSLKIRTFGGGVGGGGWYFQTNPSITSLNNFTFNLTLSSFVVNSTIDVNSSIKFQLAINNEFMYWDGSLWDNIADDQTNTYYFENQANDETTVDLYIDELASEGNLSVRAFLHNDYNSTPLLDNIYIDTINDTIPVVGIFHELIKDNSFENLGFGFDFYTIKAFMDFNAYNLSEGDNLTIYFLYVLPYTTPAFLNGLILYRFDTIEDTTKTIDIPKVSLQSLDIEASDKKEISLVSNYHFEDLIILVEANGNPSFTLFLELEIIWYKTEVDIQRNFVEDIFAMDDPLDFPIFLVLFPILLIFSGDQFGFLIGLTVGIIEVILLLGVIKRFQGAI